MGEGRIDKGVAVVSARRSDLVRVLKEPALQRTAQLESLSHSHPAAPLAGHVVRCRFGDNAELMGAWESARNVARSFQSKNEPESGAGGSETPKAA